MRNLHTLFTIVLPTCLSLTAKAADPAYISLDFTAAPTTSQTGPAAVGLSATDFWNTYERKFENGNFIGSGTVDDLKTVQGVATPIDLSVNNAPGAWGTGHPDIMMDGYLYPFDGGDITISLLDLPRGTYDLYLYGHGGHLASPTQWDAYNSVFSVKNDGADEGTKSTTSSDPDWLTTNWQDGRQYVLFDQLNVAANGSLEITVKRGQGSEAYVNGLQLVARFDDSSTSVPDSGTYLFDGVLAMLGIAAARRYRR